MRALTRIAAPDSEAGLAEIAGPVTGNQRERFARAHRRVGQADDAAARVRRRLVWRFEDDGSLAGAFRLPPPAGAVLLKALRAAACDLEHSHEDQDDGVSAETPAAPAAAGQERQGGRERQVARKPVQVFEPEGWAGRIRRHCDEHATRPPRPVLVPVPV